MNFTITSQLIPTDDFDHGVEHGRFWDTPTFYLYCMAWDPFLLARLGTVPRLREPDEPLADPDQTMLLFARPNVDEEDNPYIRQVLDAGGHAVLNHPTPEQIGAMEETFCADGHGDAIVSLRERWHLEGAARTYIYPHTQKFLRLDPSAGRVCSRIGGNPDLLLGRHIGVFAGDPMAVVLTYQHTPDTLSQLMADLAALLVQTAAHFTGVPVTREDQRRLTRTVEIRRDFHSLGFACMTVQELARCYDREPVDLQGVHDQAIGAARRLVAGETRSAIDELRAAFETLAEVNRDLQPIPAVFTDTFHGGELYPDIGYFEIDWPEHPAGVLRTSLHWAKTRSYRFNVDLGATTVRELALRFPDLFEIIRKQQARGHIEFVNGSCNQPYPPFHSLESQIRQFDTGRTVWQQVLGRSPQTYASQEFGFTPQLASILHQQGYRQAVVRVQNMGDAPTRRQEQVQWEAPNGDKIRALPSHPHKSEKWNQFTYNNLHLKLFLHGQDGLDFAVFTCIGDITFHRPMREELIRVCHYAPVFGRFETFDRYFRQTRKIDAPRDRMGMAEFNCDAAFINLDLWPVYKDFTGNYNSNCMNSMSATTLFAAAELIDAVQGAKQDCAYHGSDHEQNWEALTHYQGHGTYIVPFYASGGFLGLGDNPRSRKLKRGVPNVTEYLGPTDFRPVKAVTDKLMDEARQRAETRIRDRLGSDDVLDPNASAFCLYHFAPACEMIVRLPGAAGRSFEQAGCPVAGQDDGADQIVHVTLPGYGITTLQSSTTGPTVKDEGVRVEEDSLENDRLRAEFDLASGTLRRLVSLADGRELIGPGSGAFYFPSSGPQRCVAHTVAKGGPLRGAIHFEIEVKEGCDNISRLRQRVSLDIRASVLTFETEVLEAPAVEGNQWKNHLGLRFQLPMENPEILASHYNVLEPFPLRQIYSTNLLVVRDGGEASIFLNEGNQFYVQEDGRLDHILVMENEPERHFRSAVGIAEGNPIMQARRWAGPCFVHPVGGPTFTEGPLVEISSEDVELLSCRFEGGGFLVRLANTCDREVRTTLALTRSISAATIATLAGVDKRKLTVRDGRTALTLRPWGIRQVKLSFE